MLVKGAPADYITIDEEDSTSISLGTLHNLERHHCTLLVQFWMNLYTFRLKGIVHLFQQPFVQNDHEVASVVDDVYLPLSEL